MTPLGLFAILLTLSALFGVLNHRTLRLPNAIGVLVFALSVSLAVLAIDRLVPGANLQKLSRGFLATIDLPKTLLNGALSFLLFAGALQVDLRHLWARMGAVLALALLGTLLAVVLFAGAMWVVFPLLGQAVPLVWCIVLGAILAPTDPMSVAGMLARVNLLKPLQAVFAGESLFNDGIGVVVFGVAISVATGGATSPHDILARFLVEFIGGGLLGLILGWIAVQFMKVVDDARLELIISLALASGAFALANSLQMSGPIAVVVAGLSLGSRPSLAAITTDGHRELMTFWSTVDEILNVLLFLLIGFEVVALAFHYRDLAAVALAIPLSVAVRALSVFLATLPVPLREAGRGNTLAVLTWGGLRGGISVALALSLPPGNARASLLAVSYGVVVFSIIVQGLTVERLAAWLYKLPPAKAGR